MRVLEPDITALREAILAPKFNFGAPAVLPSTSATTARSSCSTTTRPTAAAST